MSALNGKSPTARGAGKRVLIVGAGISGLTLAAALGQQGWDVDVIERNPEISDGGGVGLTIVGNAMRALSKIGVAEQCVAVGMPTDVMKMMKAEGSLLFENPLPRIGGPEWPGGTSITRANFHAILLDAARPVSRIRCSIMAQDWSEDSAGVDVTFNDGSTEHYDLMVAADGVYSSTRARLMPDVKPQLTGQACWRVPVRRPAEVRCTYLHIGGRQGAVGICPVAEDQAYVYIVQTDDGSWRDPETLDVQMREELVGYGGLVAELAEELTDPGLVSFRPLESLLAPKPWGRGRILMIGDAVHANPPVLAQGAAMGIEDAVILGETLAAARESIDKGLSDFIDRRFDRVKHVVEASCQLAQWETEKRHDVDIAGLMRLAAERLMQPA